MANLRHSRWLKLLAVGVVVLTTMTLSAVKATADAPIAGDTTWEIPSLDQRTRSLRESLLEIGGGQTAVDDQVRAFEAQIASQDVDVLHGFVESVAMFSQPVKQLVELAASDLLAAAASLDPSESGYTNIESLPKPISASLRTWLARSLVQNRFYDEALPVVAEVDIADSLDPVTTLFYRGTCYHALLLKKEALVDLLRLLQQEENTPVRYSRMATMMVADIKPLKEDSLDEISRLMSDVTRRLDLGRANDKVEDQEQKIIDKLDKLIEKLEEQAQQQQQQQQGGGGGGSGKPSGSQGSPMQDSQIAGGQGNGNIKKKDLGDGDGWGNLPPAERKEALQKISRDLPTHYRDAIEAYFRKQATDR